MILDPRTLADTGQPEIEKAWLADAQDDAGQMDQDCGEQHPSRFEQQEKLRCNDSVHGEIAVRNPCKHLRARKGYEDGVMIQSVHGLSRPAARSTGFRQRCWPLRTG